MWDPADLQRLSAASEIQLASHRPDRSLRPWVTIWAVAVGGTLYVRSAYGADNPWYRRARASGSGRIRSGALEFEVAFADAAAADHRAIDAAYYAKYDRYGPRIVGSVVGENAALVTLTIHPLV
jgi:hypothetical protein